FSFFFEAEDGIRDATVTGVQTCALPILADAPLVEVSSTARRGLDELLATLERVLGDAPRRRDVGRPRLPIDRSFTMSGFGTVVKIGRASCRETAMVIVFAVSLMETSRES